MGFGQECEKILSSYFCSCRTKDSQTLLDLLHLCLRVSLMHQCPAAGDSAVGHPVWKSLFRGKADGSFGAFLGDRHLATALMEHGGKTQDKTQVKGVRHLLYLRQRGVHLSPPLVRI